MGAPTRVMAAAYECAAATIHPRGPKISVRCGSCGGTFAQRPGVRGLVQLACPHCRTVNVLDLVW